MVNSSFEYNTLDHWQLCHKVGRVGPRQVTTFQLSPMGLQFCHLWAPFQMCWFIVVPGPSLFFPDGELFLLASYLQRHARSVWLTCSCPAIGWFFHRDGCEPTTIGMGLRPSRNQVLGQSGCQSSPDQGLCNLTIDEGSPHINGNFRILKWRYVNVPYFWPYFLGIFPEI